MDAFTFISLVTGRVCLLLGAARVTWQCCQRPTAALHKRLSLGASVSRSCSKQGLVRPVCFQWLVNNQWVTLEDSLCPPQALPFQVSSGYSALPQPHRLPCSLSVPSPSYSLRNMWPSHSACTRLVGLLDN